MTDAGYVFAGYAATAGVLAAYAGWIISRTRRLAAKAQDDDGVRVTQADNR